MNIAQGASVSHCLSVGGVEEDGMRTACLGAVVREEVTDRLWCAHPGLFSMKASINFNEWKDNQKEHWFSCPVTVVVMNFSNTRIFCVAMYLSVSNEVNTSNTFT